MAWYKYNRENPGVQKVLSKSKLPGVCEAVHPLSSWLCSNIFLIYRFNAEYESEGFIWRK